MFSRNQILYTLAMLNFVHIMDVMIMMPLGDVFMREFSVSSQAFSILVSAYSIGAFLSSIVGFFYMDRFGRKQALMFINAGFAIGTILCGFANSYVQLLLFRFITGVFGGIIGALALAIISDLFLFKERGKAMGILMGAFSVASALGVPFGLFLADYLHWHVPFFVVGGISLLLGLLIHFKFPILNDHLSGQSAKLNPVKTILQVVGDRNQVNALVVGMVLVFGHFLIIPFIAPYMIRNIGFTQTSVIYIYFAGGVATAFTSPFFGKLTDKIGVLKLFMALMILSFIPVLLITHLRPVAIPIALVVTSLFFVLGSGRMIPPQTLISAAVGPDSRGSFMSIKAALQQLAVAVAAIVSGLMVKDQLDGTIAHYDHVGYLSVAVCIIAMILLPKLKVVQGN